MREQRCPNQVKPYFEKTTQINSMVIFTNLWPNGRSQSGSTKIGNHLKIQSEVEWNGSSKLNDQATIKNRILHNKIVSLYTFLYRLTIRQL